MSKFIGEDLYAFSDENQEVIQFRRGKDKKKRQRRRKIAGAALGAAAGAAAVGGALAARKRMRTGALASGKAGGSPQMQMAALQARANSPGAKAGRALSGATGRVKSATGAVKGAFGQGASMAKASRSAGSGRVKSLKTGIQSGLSDLKRRRKKK